MASSTRIGDVRRGQCFILRGGKVSEKRVASGKAHTIKERDFCLLTML